MNVSDVNGIPPIGLGTWLRTGEDGYRAMRTAIDLGYRHLDTAQTYNTDENVGRAVNDSGLPRSDLFVVTKVTNANLPRDRFMPSLHDSLRRMKLDYVDLTLIHWPSAGDEVPLAEYMEELAEAKAAGLTRLIGVSNFTVAHLDEAVGIIGKGEIATNQVEYHPFLQCPRLTAGCARLDIPVTAYMPLAKGRVSHDLTLIAIGIAHGILPSTVSLAWLLQKAMIVIPASAKPEHMKANLMAASVRLSAGEIATIDKLDRGERIIDPAGLAPAWDD
jgi:2,5-diketo-D-gluconate reductase B